MDAKFLAGSVRRGSKDGFEYQMAVYSIDNHTYRVLSEPLDGVKEDVEPQWLSDGRRLFFKSRGADAAYSILDPETGEQNEVMTSKDVAVGRSGQAFLATISPDNRDIYIHWYYAESAIWMLTLREE